MYKGQQAEKIPEVFEVLLGVFFSPKKEKKNRAMLHVLITVLCHRSDKSC